MINITEGNQIWAPSEAKNPIPDSGRFGWVELVAQPTDTEAL